MDISSLNKSRFEAHNTQLWLFRIRENIHIRENSPVWGKPQEKQTKNMIWNVYFTWQMFTNDTYVFFKLREDGTTLSTTHYEADLQERTLFEGFCPLEYSNDEHWVTEFTFNISNDGSRFTENYNVYTYQSLCQIYQNNTGNITFLFKVYPNTIIRLLFFLF